MGYLLTVTTPPSSNPRASVTISMSEVTPSTMTIRSPSSAPSLTTCPTSIPSLLTVNTIAPLGVILSAERGTCISILFFTAESAVRSAFTCTDCPLMSAAVLPRIPIRTSIFFVLGSSAGAILVITPCSPPSMVTFSPTLIWRASSSVTEATTSSAPLFETTATSVNGATKSPVSIVIELIVPEIGLLMIVFSSRARAASRFPCADLICAAPETTLCVFP